jgi:hypothetical protein
MANEDMMRTPLDVVNNPQRFNGGGLKARIAGQKRPGVGSGKK